MDDVGMEMWFRVWVHLGRKRHHRSDGEGAWQRQRWGDGYVTFRGRGGHLMGVEGRSGVKGDEVKREVGLS